MEYAGSWRRFIAMIIDAIVAGLLAFAICLLITFVQTIKDGFMPFDPIRVGRAFARNFSEFLSGLILHIGFLMAAFTSRKQALHDIMTGCLVVKR